MADLFAGIFRPRRAKPLAAAIGRLTAVLDQNTTALSSLAVQMHGLTESIQEKRP